MAWLSIGSVEKDRVQEALDTVAASRLESAVSWAFRGYLLREHLARYDEAEQAYRRAIEIDPKDAYPWNEFGTLLQVHLARYDEAEQAYRRAIEIDPKDAYPWNGSALCCKSISPATTRPSRPTAGPSRSIRNGALPVTTWHG